MSLFRALDVVAVFAADGVLHVACADPRACAICGGSHHFFLNRDGRTRCFYCDGAYLATSRERRAANRDHAPIPAEVSR